MVVQICKFAARQRDVGQYPEYGRAAIVPISVVVVVLQQSCGSLAIKCMVIAR